MLHHLPKIGLSACLLALLLAAADTAAAPRPTLKPAPKISLFDTYDSFAAHFTKFDGNIFYQPKSKSVLINGSDGTIAYNAGWEQLEFDLAWDKVRPGNHRNSAVFTLGAGDDPSAKESIDVGNDFPAPGKYAVKITYKAPLLSLYINGNLARKPITVANPKNMETLYLHFRVSFVDMLLSNPQVTGAAPEKNPPFDTATIKAPAHPTIIPLFQTAQDFNKRWTTKILAEYDARTKSITVLSAKGLPSYPASFTYAAPWQELELALNCTPDKMFGSRPPDFAVEINTGRGYSGESFRLDSSLAHMGLNRIKLVIDDGHTLTAYLNGRPSGHPITLIHDTALNHPRFEIRSGDPIQIGDVKIKADPEP